MVTARPRYGGALFFGLTLPRWIVAPRELMARGVAAAVVLTLVACDSAPPVQVQRLTLPDGTALAYTSIGRGPDTVVVLHGGPGLQMRYLVGEWSGLQEGRTLIFYDQRGRGRSDAAPDSLLSASADAEDLEWLRRGLAIGRFSLAAHHSGAPIATLYARRHPERVNRILLVSPSFARRSYSFWAAASSPNDSAATARVIAAVKSGDNRRDPVAFCRRFWGFWFSPVEVTNSAVVTRLAPGVCDLTPAQIAAVDRINDRYYRSAYRLDLQDSLATVHVPVLVIQGEGDEALAHSAATWAAWLPEGRQYLIPAPASPLFPWIGQEREFFAAANRFLDGSWPAAAIRPSEPTESVTTTSLVR